MYPTKTLPERLSRGPSPYRDPFGVPSATEKVTRTCYSSSRLGTSRGPSTFVYSSVCRVFSSRFGAHGDTNLHPSAVILLRRLQSGPYWSLPVHLSFQRHVCVPYPSYGGYHYYRCSFHFVPHLVGVGPTSRPSWEKGVRRDSSAGVLPTLNSRFESVRLATLGVRPVGPGSSTDTESRWPTPLPPSSRLSRLDGVRAKVECHRRGP